MALTPHQLERYKRHVFLREIGSQGQQKLLASRVLLVGLGGLGCPILAYLVAGGVGHIGVVDDDRVERSNLQRQILFRDADIGRLKTDVAADFARAQNPDTSLTSHPLRLDDRTGTGLVGGYDLVVEGVDNFETRFVLNDLCLQARIPLLSTAIGRFEGQVALFEGHIGGRRAPCYRCLVPEMPEGMIDCEAEGVLGALAGMVGSFAAIQALMYLSGYNRDAAPSLMAGAQLHLIDGLSGTMRTVRVVKDESCRACSKFRKLGPAKHVKDTVDI